MFESKVIGQFSTGEKVDVKNWQDGRTLRFTVGNSLSNGEFAANVELLSVTRGPRYRGDEYIPASSN
jgi:hypothetical protein